MAFVRGEDVHGIVALGEDDVRGVRQADVLVSVMLDHIGSASQIFSTEWFETVAATGDVSQDFKGYVRGPSLSESR